MDKRHDNHDDLFESLARAGLSKQRFAATLEGSDRRNLVRLGLRFCEAVPHVRDRAARPFGFVANNTLSGAPFPCGSYKCRSTYLDQAARYAALYADRVIIRDPFENLGPRLARLADGTGSQARQSVKATRKEFMLELRLLYQIRPLLSAGIIEIADTPGHFCPSCHRLRQSEITDEFAERYRELHKKLERILCGDVPFYVEKDRGPAPFTLHIDEHEWLGHHGSMRDFDAIPKALAAKLSPGAGRYRLSVAEARACPVAQGVINQILDDLVVQSIYAVRSGEHYLTDRPIDMQLIQTDEEATVLGTAANRALVDGMAHSLPFVQSVPLDTLMELRRKEGDAFEVYRNALHRALEQSKGNGASEVRRAVQDLVKPEVDKIEVAMNSARKMARRALVTNFSVASGFVTAGIWSGMMPASLAAVVTAIGGLAGVKAAVGDLPALWTDPPELRKEQYYFLWRVKKAAKD